MLRNKSAASQLENERANNSSKLLIRELDKFKVEFRSKAEELDDFVKRVGALPQKVQVRGRSVRTAFP